jgi:anti-anti-sigma factor
VIRLKVPCSLEYRDVALRVVAGACKLVRPRRDTDPRPAEADFDDQVVTSFGEAFTNVVVHGGSPPEAEVELEIETHADRLTIRLLDHGKPFELAAVPRPDLEELPEHGMGVHIMRSWMDEVKYEGAAPGAPSGTNVLSMTKRLGDFSRSDEGDATVLRITGVLDAMTVPNIRRTIDAIVTEQRSPVTVDLSALRLIDSSGVGIIVSLYKRCRAYGGVVRVDGLRDQPLAIFKLLRLDRVFEF